MLHALRNCGDQRLLSRGEHNEERGRNERRFSSKKLVNRGVALYVAFVVLRSVCVRALLLPALILHFINVLSTPVILSEARRKIGAVEIGL